MIANSIRTAYDTEVDRDYYRDAKLGRIERQTVTAFGEAPNEKRAHIDDYGGAIPVVKSNVLSLAIEQQHIIAELEKVIDLLNEKLIPISTPQAVAGYDQQKEPNRVDSELYSMISSNTRHIVKLIYTINSMREGVQL